MDAASYTWRKTRLATVPIGYADGHPDCCTTNADMLVCAENGTKSGFGPRMYGPINVGCVTDIPEAGSRNETAALIF